MTITFYPVVTPRFDNQSHAGNFRETFDPNPTQVEAFLMHANTAGQRSFQDGHDEILLSAETDTQRLRKAAVRVAHEPRLRGVHSKFAMRVIDSGTLCVEATQDQGRRPGGNSRGLFLDYL